MPDKYVYDKKKFCIPVTKAEPLSSIQFIINDFIEKKISFCLDGVDDSWEIWREVQDGDTDKIKKSGSPSNPKKLYINGKLVEDFKIKEQ